MPARAAHVCRCFYLPFRTCDESINLYWDNGKDSVQVYFKKIATRIGIMKTDEAKL